MEIFFIKRVFSLTIILAFETQKDEKSLMKGKSIKLTHQIP